MLSECIDGADVEPWKAIRSFVLYHPCDDALADSDCGNLLQAAWVENFFWDCSHPTWTSILSHKKKKKRRQNKIVGGGRGHDAECNGVIG